MGILDFKHHTTNPLLLIFAKSKDQQTHSVKGQMINILGFIGHVFFVSTTKFCHCRTKPTLDNMWICPR